MIRFKYYLVTGPGLVKSVIDDLHAALQEHVAWARATATALGCSGLVTDDNGLVRGALFSEDPNPELWVKSNRACVDGKTFFVPNRATEQGLALHEQICTRKGPSASEFGHRAGISSMLVKEGGETIMRQPGYQEIGGQFVVLRPVATDGREAKMADMSGLTEIPEAEVLEMLRVEWS